MEEKDTTTAKVTTINPDYKHSKMFSFSPVTKVVSLVMTTSWKGFQTKRHVSYCMSHSNLP